MTETKIRNQFRPEESFAEDNALPYKKLFLGKCHGVILRKRGRNDSHVCFQLIVEDDEQWFMSKSGISSSYWLDDCISVLQAAKEWIEKNCKPDGNHGWKFKDNKSQERGKGN